MILTNPDGRTHTKNACKGTTYARYLKEFQMALLLVASNLSFPQYFQNTLVLQTPKNQGLFGKVRKIGLPNYFEIHL